jgi:hypothetical protein
MENTYWNNKGTYQSEYEVLDKKLVPAAGPAETLGGEILRASGRLYYDAYNNGFLNNTSGALNFLRQEWASKFPVDITEEVFNLLATKVNTGDYSDLCEKTEEALEQLADATIKWILDNPEESRNPSPCDLFSYQDEAERDDLCDECGECNDYCECFLCGYDDEDEEEDEDYDEE